MAMVKCLECKQDISDKAATCPKCGAPINYSIIEAQRSAYTQSKINQDLSNGFMLQILIASIAMGYAKESWLMGAGTFIGLFIVLMIPYIGKIVALALACFFALAGYLIGESWWGREAGYVFAGLFFLISLGWSFGGKTAIDDMGKK